MAEETDKAAHHYHMCGESGVMWLARVEAEDHYQLLTTIPKYRSVQWFITTTCFDIISGQNTMVGCKYSRCF
jgi:hypothetical protein